MISTTTIIHDVLYAVGAIASFYHVYIQTAFSKLKTNAAAAVTAIEAAASKDITAVKAEVAKLKALL